MDENEKDQPETPPAPGDPQDATPEAAPDTLIEAVRDDAAGAEPVAPAAAAEVPADDAARPADGEAAPAAEPSGDAAADDGEDIEPTEPVPPSPEETRAIVEALVFASPQPITHRELGKVLQGVPRAQWMAALEALKEDYRGGVRGLQLVEVAGGYQITTRPEYHGWVRELLDPKAPTKLSIQALETLAVIAYKQPVTLPEIIELRGVKSGGVVKTLLEKRLVRITGRKEVVGRPILYGTTKDFLLHFGMKDLSELPKIEEFAEVLGEEVDVAGLKRAIESPRPVETPLSEEEVGAAEPPSEPPTPGAEAPPAPSEDAEKSE